MSSWLCQVVRQEWVIYDSWCFDEWGIIMFKIWVVLIFILGVNCQLCDDKVCTCTNNTCLACTAAFLYRTNITCSPCPFMCKTCSSALSCSGCISNFYLVNGSCLLCPRHCMACTPVCAKCMVLTLLYRMVIICWMEIVLFVLQLTHWLATTPIWL